MSTTRSMLITLLLAVFGLTGLTGCADVSDVWTQDLVKAGFTDPVPIKEAGKPQGSSWPRPAIAGLGLSLTDEPTQFMRRFREVISLTNPHS